MRENEEFQAEEGRHRPGSEHLAHPFEESERRRRVGCFTPLGLIAVGAFLFTLFCILPNFIRARPQARLSGCKPNLKNIGTAMEMYSTDWSGHYPTSLSLLTPKYLKTIPDCPAVGRATYDLITGKNVGYNTVNGGFDDYYLVYCNGENHTSIGITGNYPQYDGIAGLIER